MATARLLGHWREDCGRHNGSAELADGTYCWPEGLAHYLEAHQVRPPEEFVEHVVSGRVSELGLPAPAFDPLGQRDRSWPGAQFEALLWMPDPPAADNRPDLERDPAWWLKQSPLIEWRSGRPTS